MNEAVKEKYLACDKALRELVLLEDGTNQDDILKALTKLQIEILYSKDKISPLLTMRK